MKSHLYVEGGGDSKELKSRCREGFSKLLANAGFDKRMPRLTACGGRASTFDHFKTAHSHSNSNDFVAMLIDSEDPIADIEKTWAHLKQRDNWDKPGGATDGQVLFMTTCMETWIVADRAALRRRYGQKLNKNKLPPLASLEARSRHDVQDKLSQASPYTKGQHSFQVLAQLDPATLQTLPSFARAVRILNERL